MTERREDEDTEEGVADSWAGGDRRFIDPAVGTLSGEGSQQRISGLEPAAGSTGVGGGVWRATPSESFDGAEPTYYGRPLVKAPVWIWSVPLYFYVGGAAGAAAVLGAAAQVAGGPEVRGLVRRCRWVAAGGTAVSSLLLIHDLGRPERFLNMLRVFRPTSPMSVGSWVLAGAGAVTGCSAVLSRRTGWLGWLGDAAGVGGALLGMPLAGYTAVLLGDTAVPLWQATRRTLPPLFAGSAMSAAASLCDLMELGPREERIVQRFGIAGKVADLAAIAAVERDAGRVTTVAQPLRAGLSGALWRSAKVLTAASLVLTVASSLGQRHAAGVPAGGTQAEGLEARARQARRERGQRRRRQARLAAGLLGTAGALALRFGIFHAGKASAADPRASFRQQRAGYGARELTEP
jgi:formate-dependent nitrite reductase membrane component NrfD